MFKRFWWIFPVMASAGFSVGLLVAAIITYQAPRIFESEGIIEVKQPTDTTRSVKLMNPRRFSEIETKVIANQENLEAVVDQLHLKEKWRTDGTSAVQILREAIHCQPVRGKNLISVRGRSRWKDEARDITACLIENYELAKSRLSDTRERTIIAGLLDDLYKQQEKTDESRDAWLDSRKNSDSRSSGGLASIQTEQQYDTDQKLLRDLLKKLEVAKASIDASKVSVNTRVVPEIQDLPVSPDIQKNLNRGMLMGLTLSPSLALVLIILLNRMNPVTESDQSGNADW